MTSSSPMYKNQAEVFAPCIDYSQLLTINGINFTRREIDIIACLLNGRTTKLAASLLAISHKTIYAHIRSILLKLKGQTQHKILDFIEKSDKYVHLKSHYTKLLIHTKFEDELRHLQNTYPNPTSICLVIDQGSDNNFAVFVKQLTDHLKLAGINVSPPSAQNIEGHFLYCAFAHDISSFTANKISRLYTSPTIFLTLGQDISDATEHVAPNHIYINLLEHEHYYLIVFLLLEKLLPSAKLESYSKNFKELYNMLISNEVQFKGPQKQLTYEEDVSLGLEYSNKKLFTQHGKWIITTICVLVAIIYSVLILSKNNTPIQAQSNINDFAINNAKFMSVQIKAGGSVTWNLPRQDHKFIGRETLLEELRNKLHSHTTSLDKKGNPGLFSVAVCAGLGGIGKTQLALQYIHNSKHFYTLKAWFSAESLDQLKQEYIEFAWALGYRDRAPSFENSFAYVKEWLSKHPQWLLVYDSVNSYEDIKDYLPTMEGGNVILTTRQQNWPNTFKKLNIDVMTEKESMDLIHSLASEHGSPDENIIKELVKTLGYLPLALSQAGAYIRQTSITFADYSKLYNEHAQEFLNDNTLPEGTNSRPVATTWNISLDAIAKEDTTKHDNPLALQLLSACAYFAPSKIPHELLLSWLKVSYPKAANHEIILARLIGQLSKYSMINKDEAGNITIHRLVQTVVRYQQTSTFGEKTYCSPLTKKGFNILLNGIHNEFIRKDQVLENERRQKILLPHMRTLLTHYESIWPNSLDVNMEPLLNDIGVVFSLIGEWRIGASYHERALQVMERHYGKNSIKVANSLDLLGNAARHSGDIKQAQITHERAFALKEKHYGKNHVEVAITLDYLGRDYRSLGSFKLAKELHERSLVVKERHYGKDHVEVAYTLDQLGRDYRNLWDAKQAKKLHERSLMIKEVNYGKDHVEVAYTLDQLGSEYRYLGDAKQAKKLHERSLLIKEKYYGKDHVKVAHTIDQLGMDFMYLGEIKQAKLLHESSLKIKEKHYGSNHIELSSTLEHLGKENAYLGNFKQAKILHESALLIKKLYHGSNHPEIAETYTNLGAISIKLHNLPQAKIFLDQALVIKEHYHGIDNVALVETLIEFGNYYKYLHNIKQAKEYLTRALKIRQQYFGEDNPLTLEVKRAMMAQSTNEDKG